MTIKGLTQFLHNKIPDTIKQIKDIKGFKGKKFIIDGTFYIYKFMYVAWKSILNDKNRKNKFESKYYESHVLIRHYIIKKSIQLLKKQYEYFKSLNINTLYIIEDVEARSKLQPLDFKCKKYIWKERELIRKKKKLFDILNLDYSKYDICNLKNDFENTSKDDINLKKKEQILCEETLNDINCSGSGENYVEDVFIDINNDNYNISSLILNKYKHLSKCENKKKLMKCKMNLFLNKNELFQKNIFIKINPETANDIYNYLLFEKIPIYITKNDAEKECAIQCSNDKDIVVSDDIDALVFGAPNLIRFISNKKKRHLINKEELLNQLNINYEQFIDFCILSGCDYSAKIPGIGPVKAHEIIKKYETIEKFLKSNTFKKYKNSKIFNKKLNAISMTLDDYIGKQFNYEQARKIFLNSY